MISRFNELCCARILLGKGPLVYMVFYVLLWKKKLLQLFGSLF